MDVLSGLNGKNSIIISDRLAEVQEQVDDMTRKLAEKTGETDEDGGGTIMNLKRAIKRIKEEVKEIEARTEIKRAELKPLKRENTNLVTQILQAKERKDTVTIVVTQDSLIEVQRMQVKTLESVVFMQDKTILGLKEIIEFQEIETNSLQIDIEDRDRDLKKFKRQKNLALIGSAIFSGLLIYILK